jgi:hypothetical protein
MLQTGKLCARTVLDIDEPAELKQIVALMNASPPTAQGKRLWFLFFFFFFKNYYYSTFSLAS